MRGPRGEDSALTMEGWSAVSSTRFGGGLALSVLTIGPLLLAAVALRARFLPRWRGAAARVAEAVMTLAGITIVAELLGVIGIFGRWEMVALSATTGTACWWWARRQGEDRAGVVLSEGSTDRPHPAPSRLAVLVAGAATAVVGVQWIAPSLDALRNGMQDRVVDTFWYHGPMAARFVQEGSITGVHYFDRDPVTAFFPGGSALLHAVGILLFGNDVASPALNLVFVVLALVAGWSIGARWGLGPHTMLAVVVVLGTPMLIETQPGGMYNDVVGLALVLASVALLVESDRRGFALGVAALAAGLAIGVKLTMLPTVGLLTVGVIMLTPRGRRLATGGTWLALLASTGALWYVRNLVAAGNPVPGLSLSFGPVSLPDLPTSTPTDAVASYLTNGHVIRELYLPGLDQSLGAAWWAILPLAIGGGLWVAMRGRDVTLRIVGAVAFVGFIAYLVQPQYLGVPGLPLFFAVNVRYAAAPLALGLLSLTALRAMDAAAGRNALLGALAAIVATTQVDTDRLWLAPTRDVALAIAAVVAGGALAWLLVTTRACRARSLVVMTILGVAVVVGAWWLQRDYLERRYSGGGISNPLVVEAIRGERDRRIAIQGLFLQYALDGPDLSNTVDYVADRGPHGTSRDFTSCRAFKHAVNRGGYDYLVVARASYPSYAPPDDRARSLVWAASSEGDGLREVARDDGQAVTYAITGRLDPASCPEV